MINIENWEAHLVEDGQEWRMNVKKNEKVGNSSDTPSPLARLNIEQPILGLSKLKNLEFEGELF